MLRLLFVLFFSVSAIGCGSDPFWLPPAHKITIQQGNLLTEKQVARITVGMQRDEVRSVIGTPVANSVFAENRWDYMYTQAPAGNAVKARKLTLFFEENTVSKISTNTDETTGVKPAHRNWWEILFPPKREGTGL